MSSNKAKYGITLSGGGARGFSHIGVLAALHDHGIEPEVVSGASMGAIIGAMYACGISPAGIYDIVRKEKFLRLFSIDLPLHGGMTSLKKVEKEMERILPYKTFGWLPKELFISATNLTRGEGKVFSSGSLVDAVVASATIPVVFKPKEIKGDLYVDGGIFLNMPAKAIRDRCGIQIGSHVNYIEKNWKPGNLKSVAERSYKLMVYQNVLKNLEICDIVIDPPKTREYGLFEFHKIEELYEIGYKEAEKVIRNTDKLRDS